MIREERVAPRQFGLGGLVSHAVEVSGIRERMAERMDCNRVTESMMFQHPKVVGGLRRTGWESHRQQKS